MKQKIAESVAVMAEMIPFFPRGEIAQMLIMREIQRFCDRADALSWLTETACRSIRKWSGIAELRGIYCTRFRPADGIEVDSTVPGHSPEDSEARYIESKAEETRLRLEQYKGDAKRLPAPEQEAEREASRALENAIREMLPNKGFPPPESPPLPRQAEPEWSEQEYLRRGRALGFPEEILQRDIERIRARPAPAKSASKENYQPPEWLKNLC